MKKEKIAVILLNLGAPDNLNAVRPFLFNLFSDWHIIRLPLIMRIPLAFLIAKKRTKTASENYQILGGKSPLLENTEQQSQALEHALQSEKYDFKCFIAMRYWHPMSLQTSLRVKKWNPDKILLLPLYPQFSTTTTLSSFKEWEKAAKRVKLKKPTLKLCCYPTDEGFIEAEIQLIKKYTRKIKDLKKWRLLFTAHGLPQKIVDAGDPYQWQIEQTAHDIAKKIKFFPDWKICYQSRVGPLEWIKPYMKDEIIRAGREKKSLMIVPIAFVSEHSETLVELDQEYAELAKQHGVKDYIRIPTASVDKYFITGLKSEIHHLLQEECNLSRSKNGIKCPHKFTNCPHK